MRHPSQTVCKMSMEVSPFVWGILKNGTDIPPVFEFESPNSYTVGNPHDSEPPIVFTAVHCASNPKTKIPDT